MWFLRKVFKRIERLVRESYLKAKKRFVKKAELEKVVFKDDIINLTIGLKKYKGLKKSDFIVNLTDESGIEKLDYELKDKKIIIRMNVAQIKKELDYYQLQLVWKGEEQWITHSPQFDNQLRNFILNGKYYRLILKKSVYFRIRFKEYYFAQKSYKAYTTFPGEKNEIPALSINSKEIPENRNFRLFSLRGNTLLNLGEFSSGNTYSLENITIGDWSLFLEENETLYNIQDKLEGKTKYTTEYFDMQLKEGKTLILSKNERAIDVENVNVIDKKNEKIILKLGLTKVFESVDIEGVLRDLDTGVEYHLPIKLNAKELIVTLNIEDFLRIKKRSKIYLRIKNKNNTRVYNLKIITNKIEGEFKNIHHYFNNVTYKVEFYIRKDKGLGIKKEMPKIFKEITHIKDFKLKGYIYNTDKFPHTKTYLVLEERSTNYFEKIELNGKFVLDLKKYDLLKLQQKSKTVIDFYVQIEAEESGDIIKKEKIRYNGGEYKKDNYFDKLAIKDEIGNHYYLITITPFKNLKIETFTIPKGVIPPSNVLEKDENVWLIGERYNTAQDNGYWFYKWLKENTDLDVYYVIESEATDYEKIKDDTNVLIFGSVEHYKVAFKAKVLAGTHDLENLLPYKSARGMFGYENTYKVFLQHGVLGRKNVEYHKKYYIDPFDLFIVSSYAEKQDIVINKMGYESKEVAVTGLARFDNLLRNNKTKDILLMPTWRDWNNSNHAFLQSEYYFKYLSLITSKKLLELLEKYDVNLNFYPHYRAQEYFNEEEIDLHERVNFISLGTESVQDLLIKHSILITDYSSVSFDFTLMRKPVLYYHFDVRRFFRKGILRPVEETFLGNIAYSEQDLLMYLEQVLKDDKPEDLDISGIIEYVDTNNSKRIYQSIINGLDEV